MVDTGINLDIPVIVNHMAHNDIVDGGGHHLGIGVDAAGIAQRCLFGHDIQVFQQQTEPEVAHNRFIHNHVTAAGLQVRCKRQYFVE